jgi:predicted nucleic acid-binding protein
MTTSDKTCFLDTNILVYAADTTSPFHGACKKLREQGMTGNISLCISPQVLFDFLLLLPIRVSRRFVLKYTLRRFLFSNEHICL